MENLWKIHFDIHLMTTSIQVLKLLLLTGLEPWSSLACCDFRQWRIGGGTKSKGGNFQTVHPHQISQPHKHQGKMI